MFPFHPTGGPGNGLFPMTRKVSATARTALSHGELVKWNLTLTDDAADNMQPGSTDSTDGDDNSAWNNVINPVADDLDGISAEPLIFGLCQDIGGVADDGLAEICYFGFCSGLVIAASGNPAVGDPLEGTITTIFGLDAVLTANQFILATCNEALTAPTAGTVAKVVFYGLWLGQQTTTSFS